MTRRLRRYNHHLSVQLLGNRAVSLGVDEQALVAVSAPSGTGSAARVILHGDGGPAILLDPVCRSGLFRGRFCRIWGAAAGESAFSVMHRRGGITCNWPV